MPAKPLPPMAPWTEPYWSAARNHQLLIQQCDACGRYIFYPRRRCPTCFSAEIGWVEASGRARVRAYTVVQNNAPSAFLEEMPFVIAIVELEEGVPMTTNIVGCDPQEVYTEMPVEVVFEELTPEVTLPKFRPSRTGGEDG